MLIIFLSKILGTRNLQYNYTDTPDTFVECFIKDNNDKIRQKKKTDIVRGNPNPSYNYVVQYTVWRGLKSILFNISMFLSFLRWVISIEDLWFSSCGRIVTTMSDKGMLVSWDWNKICFRLMLMELSFRLRCSWALFWKFQVRTNL